MALLMDYIGVRCKLACNNCLSKSVSALYYYLFPVVCDWIYREYHSCLVCIHHLLHHNSKIDALMGKIFLDPVIDCPWSEQRCKAFLHSMENIICSFNIQESLLLACKARVWKILCCSRAPDCN